MATMKRERTPQRTALADAIAAADAASKSLDEALTAKENASARILEAISEQGRLEQIQQTKCATAQSLDHVITAMAGGGDVAMLEVDPHSDLRKQLADLEAEIEKWRGLRDFAQQEIELRETMLQTAQRNVALAANAVVAGSVDIGALIKETEEAQTVVIANRARLRQLLDLAPDGPDLELVRAFLGVGWLAVDWEYHPATQPARDFHEALMRDADAVPK